MKASVTESRPQNPLWRSFISHYIETVAIGLIFVLIVFGLETIFPKIGSIISVQSVSYDIALRMYDFDRVSDIPPTGTAPIVLVNFDDVNADSIVPRKKLAQLVREAGRGHARVVLLDFGLNGEGPNDAELKQALISVAPTQVVLPASLTQRGSSEECFGMEADGPRVRRLFVHRFIDPRNPRNLWTGTTELEHDTDGKIRRLCLFVKTQNNLVPSVAALTVALAHRELLKSGNLPCLYQVALDRGEEVRSDVTLNKSKDVKCVESGDDFEHAKLIDFYLPSHRHAEYSEFSASDLDPGHERSLEAFNNAIVILGSGDSLPHDVHATPIGVLPGSKILASAIYSIQKNSGKFIEPMRGLAVLGIEAMTVLIGSLVFVLVYHIGGIKALSLLARIMPTYPQPLLSRLNDWLLNNILTRTVFYLCRIGIQVTGCLLAIFIASIIIFLCEITLSIHALHSGQVIDHTGVFLGMLFEAGAHMSQSFRFSPAGEQK